MVTGVHWTDVNLCHNIDFGKFSIFTTFMGESAFLRHPRGFG